MTIDYRTDFDCDEGRATEPNGTQHFRPFIHFIPQEGDTQDYDGVEISLHFPEGTPFSTVEEIGRLLDQHVETVFVTR